MSNLIVKGTELTPTIEFDSLTGSLLIKGTSIPENPFESFDPLFKVLDSYNEKPSSKTKVDFLLEYFNTSSSKCILEVLKKIQLLHLNGNEVEINWHYEEEDEDILEIGQDFSSMIKIPFNLKVIHSN
jgi:hypothetical protein